MAKTRAYGIHLGVEGGKLTLTPCKVKVAYSGSVPYLQKTLDYDSTPKSHRFECAVNNRNHDIIQHLIYEGWDMRSNWDGFNKTTWTQTIYNDGDAPERLLKWLSKLPEYEVEFK